MSATTDSRVASHDIARLYRRHHRDLERAVTAAVRAPREAVEDACQTAWTIMLRSRPRRATWFAWLRVVAIHEAWQQCARSRHEMPVGAFIAPSAKEFDAYEHPEPPADIRDVPDQVADRIQHAQRVADLATIKPNDRRTLYLKGLGYRYTEIMRLSRGVRVTVAVLVRSDVGDMSLMGASLQPSSSLARPRGMRSRKATK